MLLYQGMLFVKNHNHSIRTTGGQLRTTLDIKLHELTNAHAKFIFQSRHEVVRELPPEWEASCAALIDFLASNFATYVRYYGQNPDWKEDWLELGRQYAQQLSIKRIVW